MRDRGITKGQGKGTIKRKVDAEGGNEDGLKFYSI